MVLCDLQVGCKCWILSSTLFFKVNSSFTYCILALALIQWCEGEGEGGGFCAVENCKPITYINKGGTEKMKTVDQEKLWHTCDTVMVLPTPWRQKRMGFYSIWLFMTTLNIPLITPSPHRQNTADYCIDSCFYDIVSHEDNHRTIEDSSHNHNRKK